MASDFYASIEDRSKPILALCVLKSASQFFNDFIHELKIIASRDSVQPPLIMVDFIRLKSYSGTDSTGKIQIIGLDSLDSLTDRNVLIVEDIIDTGRTMKELLSLVSDKKPASITVSSLLIKRTPKAIEGRPVPDICGFSIADDFVVGYGIDFDNSFRDLNHIGVISKFGYDKYRGLNE